VGDVCCRAPATTCDRYRPIVTESFSPEGSGLNQERLCTTECGRLRARSTFSLGCDVSVGGCRPRPRRAFAPAGLYPHWRNSRFIYNRKVALARFDGILQVRDLASHRCWSCLLLVALLMHQLCCFWFALDCLESRTSGEQVQQGTGDPRCNIKNASELSAP
jgi:hypothetical protein